MAFPHEHRASGEPCRVVRDADVPDFVVTFSSSDPFAYEMPYRLDVIRRANLGDRRCHGGFFTNLSFGIRAEPGRLPRPLAPAAGALY
ncbi:MAG: hypothetical protein KatS3mg076_0902 [Candidatus Binatia bacterium]|nr:MAG: hypothetical protein KatS3mg076_0902 [Candidatus Binatia bacterium]